MDNIMFKIVESEIGVYVVKYSLYNIFKYEFVKGMSNASGVLVFGGAMYFVYGVYGAIYKKLFINNTKTDMSTMTETQKSRKRRRISDTVSSISSIRDTDLDTELDTDTDTDTDTENCTCDFIGNTNESSVLHKNIKELFN